MYMIPINTIFHPLPLFQVSVESNMDTLYWCKILKAPTLHDKHHIIGYEAILSKEGYV